MTCLPAGSEERFWSRGHLFVVADGMGAHAAGELASSMATEKIAMHYFRPGPDDPREALRDAMANANSEIYQRGQSNPEFHNMGTTASSLVILPIGAVVAHVGDSRVYRLRQGTLEQLTFDHSLVWEMEASGHINGGMWGQTIPKNVITRSLGPNEVVEIDVEGPFPVKAGDKFLICSDGLTGLVDDAEIGTLMDCLPENLATRVLVDLANLRGGPDNTTVVVVSTEQSSEEQQAKAAKKNRASKRGSLISPMLIGTTVFCLGVSAFLGLLEAWGPMAVAIIITMISAMVSVVQYMRSEDSDERPAAFSGGEGPYRSYDAKPTAELYERLGATVGALKEAASENNWMMNWKKVDKLQGRGDQALKSRDPKQAIRFQSEAIIETMNQLREQNNRAANETAIDY